MRILKGKKCYKLFCRFNPFPTFFDLRIEDNHSVKCLIYVNVSIYMSHQKSLLKQKHSVNDLKLQPITHYSTVYLKEHSENQR